MQGIDPGDRRQAWLERLQQAKPGTTFEIPPPPGDHTARRALFIKTLDDRFIESDDDRVDSGHARALRHKFWNLGVLADHLAGLPDSQLTSVEAMWGEGERVRGGKLALLEEMKPGDAVLVERTSYLKGGGEMFAVLRPTAEGLTQSMQYVPLSVVRDQIARTWSPEKVEFTQASGSGELPFIVESDADLKRLHGDFLQLLPVLYPASKWSARGSGTYFAIRELAVRHIAQSQMKQGNYGDCYLLGALNAVKKTDAELYYDTVARSIFKGPQPGSYEVRFLGMPLEEMRAVFGGAVFSDRILVTAQNILERAQVRADLPDIILECAYASYVSRLKSGVEGRTMQLEWRQGQEQLAFEGGFGHRALHDFLGPAIARKKMIATYRSGEGSQTLLENGHAASAVAFLRELEGQPRPRRFIVTANTPDLEARTIQVGTRSVLTGHAHSLIDFDTGLVSLEDPRDTRDRFALPLDGFLGSFSQLSCVEIQAQYRRLEAAFTLT